MWEPGRLTTLWAFTASYRDSFTLPFFIPSCPINILGARTKFHSIPRVGLREYSSFVIIYITLKRLLTRFIRKVLPHIFFSEYIYSEWLKFGDNINACFFYTHYFFLNSLHQVVRPYASAEQVHVFLAGTSSCPACVATSSQLQLRCHLQSEFHAKHLSERWKSNGARSGL
jgi:hypothetical protein